MTSRMNQEKIGKLIAKIRKQKNLTQRELGEMVGVGFRAVSKWERGQTMPDISIINELSEILGISSDELLKGELNPKVNNPETQTTDMDSKTSKKNNKRKILLLFIPLFLIAITLGIIVIKNNREKPVEYIIKSLNPDEYQVDGTLTIEKNNITIKIDKIKFQDYDFSKTFIKNYEYNVIVNNNFMYGYGKTKEYNNIEDDMNINNFFSDFQINYHDKINNKNIKELNNGKITINFLFIDINNNSIEKNVEIISFLK